MKNGPTPFQASSYLVGFCQFSLVTFEGAQGKACASLPPIRFRSISRDFWVSNFDPQIYIQFHKSCHCLNFICLFTFFFLVKVWTSFINLICHRILHCTSNLYFLPTFLFKFFRKEDFENVIEICGRGGSKYKAYNELGYYTMRSVCRWSRPFDLRILVRKVPRK